MEEHRFSRGNPAYVMKGIHQNGVKLNNMVYATYVYINAFAWNENGE